MLTQIQVTQTPAAGRQIAAASDSVSDAILYSVPAGRSFVGFVTSSNTTSVCKINGVTITGGFSTSGAITPYPVTLVAGSVVTTSHSGNTSIYGVEQ